MDTWCSEIRQAGPRPGFTGSVTSLSAFKELVACDDTSAAIFDEDFKLRRSFQCPGGACSRRPSINAQPPRLLWPVGQRSAVLLGLADGRSLAMLSAPEGSKARALEQGHWRAFMGLQWLYQPLSDHSRDFIYKACESLGLQRPFKGL